MLLVPMRVRECVIGLVGLSRDTPDQPYTLDDQVFAQELADRAALAIDAARMYAAEQQARADAEAAVEVRNKVFSLVAHDLLNPLTSIIGYTNLLQRHLASLGLTNTERFTRGLSRIESASQQMIAQIQELRDVARLQGHRPLDLQLIPLELVSLVHRVVEAHQQMVSEHRLMMDIRVSYLMLMADEMRLERVLTNLLRNAIKYSPQGGIIRITLREEERADQVGGSVSIHDQGIGIPAPDLPHLFTPFRRGSNAEHIEGTGLGLASARHIIEQHGGTITVASEEGRGSTFTIWLPATEQA